MEKEVLTSFFRLAHELKKKTLMYNSESEIPKSALPAMMFLKHMQKDGVAVNTAMLSEKMHFGKSAVSQMLNTLEEKQLITRTINTSDRRLYDITLTEKGKKLLKEEENRMFDRINAVLDRMGEQDAKQLIALVTKYLLTVNEMNEESKR